MSLWAFYKFIEDYKQGGTLARKCNYLGEVYEPDSPGVRLRHDFERPVGAKAGTIALCYGVRFVQAICPDLSCDPAESTLGFIGILPGGFIPQAYVNESYECEIGMNDMTDVTLTGLPAGLIYTIDEAEQTGVITGTVIGPPGTYNLILTGKTAENECVLTEAVILEVGSCRPFGAAINVGTLPIAEEFDPWTHEIEFTDIENIEIIGLPDEISVTIDELEGTITLDTDELPSTGAYYVTIRGTTIPNECSIEEEFVLRILPCEVGSSVIIGTGAGWFYTNEGACKIGQPGGGQIIILDATEAEIDGLPDWVEYESIQSGDNVTLIISGVPPTGICGIPSGTFDGWELDPATGWYQKFVVVRATTLVNECTIRKTIKLIVVIGLGDCPGPTNYSELGASISVGDTSVQAGDEIIGVTLTNVNANSITLETLADATWLPDDSWIAWNGGDSPGSYLVTINGTVASGEHAGCLITHTFTMVVV
jgi:hypothetical protein